MPVVHGGTDQGVQRPSERGALRGQSGEQVPIDGHDLLHALLVQPLGMGAAGAAEPAAHGRCRAIQGRGDGAVPLALATNAFPMASVVSARRTVSSVGSRIWVRPQSPHLALRGVW